MTNFFTFAANETTSGSLFYLGSIFGSVGSVLVSLGPALLPVMFKVFNTAVLAIGTLIISYTTGTSILLTAHEGEMLGKKFHSLWLPIRTVMGLAALVPGATGYSYLQIGLMWFVMQGVGAADTLWATTVNYVNAGGATTPTTSSALRRNMITISTPMGTLFQGLTCAAASGINVTAPASAGTFNLGDGCGSIDITGTGQLTAYQQIVPTLNAIAGQLVQMDSAFVAFMNSSAPNPPVPSFVQDYCDANGISSCTPTALQEGPDNLSIPTISDTKAVEKLYGPYGLNVYGDFITTAATQYISILNQFPSSSRSRRNQLEGAEDNGWIFAGNYFYQIARINNAMQTQTTPSVSAPSGASAQASLLVSEAQALVNYLATSASSSGSSRRIKACQHISASGGKLPVGAWCSSIVNAWMHMLSGTGGENHIVASQSFGTTLLDIVSIAYVVFLGINIALGAAAAAAPLVGAQLGIAAVVWEIALWPGLAFFMVILLGLGATLAVYIPMIPYMLFAFGAINWLIAVIETMIAGPILAIGLVYPEGGHDIWGRTEQAIMLLLNIFLRPSLMIFGLIAAMLMSYVAMTYINFGFLQVSGNIMGGFSMIEFLFFIVLYTAIAATVLNKCFELIHVIPDRILRWIGGGREQFGEAGGAEKEVGRGFETSAGKIKGGAAGAQERGAKAGKEARGAKLKAAERQAEQDKHDRMMAAMEEKGEDKGEGGGGAGGAGGGDAGGGGGGDAGGAGGGGENKGD